MRKEYLIASNLLFFGMALLSVYVPSVRGWFYVIAALYALGLYDLLQKKHAIRRNFPIFGRLRYLAEKIRPEFYQYFVESDIDGTPFNREKRSIVYARSKRELDTAPFGTIIDVYAPGYEWVNHSILPTRVDPKSLRRVIGGSQCSKPYDASLLNISAMSYGSLGKNAVRALNSGARLGNFAHNTGEGGLSPYHLEKGGDIIWQIGTAYFGARDHLGRFNPEMFEKKAKLEQVKMIEIKISQGAKPGHGGILPAEKVNREVAEIRGVELGKDVISPPGHTAFASPRGLLEFVQQLRELSGGKPVGIKMCIGKRHEFLSICKAMEKYGIFPDYIAVDGGEGGTGAAPLEFSDHIGSPGIESLIFVHNALVGFGLRKELSLMSSGKIVTAFDAIKRFALGADHIYQARPMMFALGCIQARTCNSNKCPTGVATNNPYLEAGLVPEDKDKRVMQYHEATLEAIAQILGAMALIHTDDLRPRHIARRTAVNESKNYAEIFEWLEAGSLRGPGPYTHLFANAMKRSNPDSFL